MYRQLNVRVSGTLHRLFRATLASEGLSARSLVGGWFVDYLCGAKKAPNKGSVPSGRQTEEPVVNIRLPAALCDAVTDRLREDGVSRNRCLAQWIAEYTRQEDELMALLNKRARPKAQASPTTRPGEVEELPALTEPTTRPGVSAVWGGHRALEVKGRAPVATESNICPRCLAVCFPGFDGPSCAHCGWADYSRRVWPRANAARELAASLG